MKTEIEYKGIYLEVEGTYTRGETRVMYYNDLDGFPGSDSSYDINAIYVQDVDIYEIIDSHDLRTIENLILDKLEG